MKLRFLIIELTLALLTACAAPTPVLISVTPTKTSRPTSAPTFIPPTATPLTINLRVTGDLINCRLGPGRVYESINELYEGQSARAVGRNADSTWWRVRDPGNPNGYCWVSADVTEIRGKAKELPVAQAPAVTIKKIELRLEPTRIVVACDQFPQTVFFEAKITANGPVLATWRWETNAGFVSDESVLIFEEAGTNVVNGYYQIHAPNDYWIKIHVLKPNDRDEQINFPANCAP